MPLCFGVAGFPPCFWWGCYGVAFSSFLLGGVVLSPFSWYCHSCTSPLWVVLFHPFARQFNGANELNQAALKLSEAN